MRLIFTIIHRLLNAFVSVSEWVEIYYSWRPNLRDEGDNHLIQLAVARNARIVVTNNIRDFQRLTSNKIDFSNNLLEDFYTISLFLRRDCSNCGQKRPLLQK